MTEKELKSYVLRLFRYKSISDKQFRNAVNNLEQLKDIDPLFYYFNMGKLHTAFGDVDEAKNYLGRAIMLKPDHSAAYYNLYKCYVKKNDIQMARVSFNNFLRNVQGDVNFEFVIKLMDAINTIDKDFYDYLAGDFSVSESTKVGYNNLSDNEELNKLYSEVIKAFNDRDYLTCMKKLNLMNSKINEISYPMEVDTLIDLVRCLKEKDAIHHRNCLEDERVKDVSDETYANVLLRLFELGTYSQESLLRKIDEVILDDSTDRGKVLLDKISGMEEFNKYQDMILYLRGFVREKEAFATLSEEQQADFTEKRLHAKAQYKRKQNDACLESYTLLKEEYNLPICDYYIAKVMFRMGMFSQAKEKFLSYLEQGGVKTEKAYMFLAKIERIQKNRSEAKRYVNLMHRVHNVFPRDFEYVSDKQYYKKKKAKPEDDQYDQHDEVKRKKSRNIRMSEDDFSTSQELKVTDFYETGIDGKLSIIRGLLQSGNVKVANKLFEEVQRECAPEEKGKVKQFEKNRKIYKNQKRTTNS